MKELHLNMASSAHLMFNAFAKSLVLFAKSHCSASEKAAIKKEFKLFDLASQKYANDFTKRVLHNGVAVISCLKGETEVLPGVTVASLESKVSENNSKPIKGTMYGMLIAASMVQDSTNDSMVLDIVDAILSASLDKLCDVVLDDDFMDVIAKVVDAGVPDDVRRVLVKIQAQGSPGFDVADGGSAEGLGLMQLAQEVSQGLDMSTLMGVAGQGTADDAAMNTLFASINRTVVERMQDGSIDPTRLCAEASSILGKHGHLNGRM